MSADYNSNPFLVARDAHAAESVAVLADLPATYANESESIALEPRVQLAETHGDAQLLPDYEYLDADWHLASERNSYSASAGWHRDSTFYNVFENDTLQGHTLPRLEDTANIAWQRALSGRSDLKLIASYDAVNYSALSRFRLNNFSYPQGSLQYDRSLSARLSWTVSSGIGRYDSRGEGASSENRFLQSSLSRKLSERWTISTQLGYSLLNADSKGFICCRLLATPGGLELQLIPIQQRSSGGTVSYSFNLERRGERVVLDFNLSRVTQPSGLGALLTQQDALVRLSLPWSERLTLSANLHGATQEDTLQRTGPQLNGRYVNGDLNASWLWTEHWTLALDTSYLLRGQTGQPRGSGATVSFTLTRQFGRLEL